MYLNTIHPPAIIRGIVLKMLNTLPNTVHCMNDNVDVGVGVGVEGSRMGEWAVLAGRANICAPTHAQPFAVPTMLTGTDLYMVVPNLVVAVYTR